MKVNLSTNNLLKKWSFLIVAIFLLILFSIEFTSALKESQIIDEGAHLVAGYSYLINKQIYLNPEHPPLLKLLAGLFIWPLQPNFPWTDLRTTNQWDAAGKFLYDLKNDADLMLLLGRLPTMLLSLLLGFFVFLWGKKIAGIKAGLIALLFYIFDPNIIAHSRYITTDIAVTLGFVSTLYFLNEYIENSSYKNLFLLSFFFALAQVSKFSALLLLPLVILFGYLSKLSSKKYVLTFACIFLFTSLMLFIVYFGNIIPYFQGLDSLADHEKGGHFAYLIGQYDEHGFWYYFPVVFMVKTPTITLLLFFISFYLLYKLYRTSDRQNKFKNFLDNIPITLKLIIFFIFFYFIVSMINRINLGVRHLIPIYPFIYILIASIFILYFEKIKNKIIYYFVFKLLISFFIIESILIYPNYLTYFNIYAGGPSAGAKYLLDSNIDWGQDLKKLRDYLIANNINEKINLSYFGKASPEYYQINYQPLSSETKQGYIAISVQFIYSQNSAYLWLLNEKPLTTLGGSLYLYNIQK